VGKVTHYEHKAKFIQQQQDKGLKSRNDKLLLQKILSEQNRDILKEKREKT